MNNVTTTGSKCTTTDLFNTNLSSSAKFQGYETEVATKDVREQKEKFIDDSTNTSLFARTAESSQDTAEEELLQTASVTTEVLQGTTEVEELKQQIKQLKEEHAVEIEQLKKKLAEEYQLNLREFMNVLQQLEIVQPASSMIDLTSRLMSAPDHVRNLFFQYVKF